MLIYHAYVRFGVYMEVLVEQMSKNVHEVWTETLKLGFKITKETGGL